jgi:inhibitor of cysteine peptidase
MSGNTIVLTQPSQQKHSFRGGIQLPGSCFATILWLTMVLCMLTASCRTQHSMPTDLLQTDNGKTIQLPTGDRVTVSLDENPTTGYRWAIQTMTAPLLELESSDYAPPSGSAVGTGGMRRMVFAIRQAGMARLELKLWREWEGDTSVVERYAVIFDIRD